MNQPIHTFRVLLQKISSVCSGVESDCAFTEELEWIDWGKKEITTSQALKIDLASLQELSATFGDAIQFQILLGDYIALNLHTGIDEHDLQTFRGAIAGMQSVTLNIRINKTRLIEIYYQPIVDNLPGAKHCYLFLFPTRLHQYLEKNTLEVLEKNLWQDNQVSKVLFILPDEDNYLVGAKLLVLGGKYLSPNTKIDWDSTAEKLADTAYQKCRDNLKWQDAWLHHITPWHLYVQNKGDKPSPIDATLNVHFGNICLLFSADLTYIHCVDGKSIRVSRYNDLEKNLEINHTEPEQTKTLSPDHAAVLIDILEWIYDPQWTTSDRLTLAQCNFVDSLIHFEVEQRFLALFSQAAAIRKNIDWHWETFTRKKIDAYFGVVKDLETYLSHIVQGYAADISAIQKTLSDTMVAGVAVLIGSFIAALFKDPFNPLIFKMGMFTYAAYVLFFPLIYNMLSHWNRYKSIDTQIKNRKARFIGCLPHTKVSEIWESWQMDAVCTGFKRTFWCTVGIYLVVIALLLLGACIVPNLILQTNS